ncbi:MAG: DeoR/GlpR transcriptional regulator [Clostridia bacterium]|nr:DeoR/GlpR transcriptional regulator [Clostridia bacterium]
MNDRQEKIFAILNKRGSASIEQLRQEIFASEATLRRDLTQMEQEGLLIRTWGGAVSTSNIQSAPLRLCVPTPTSMPKTQLQESPLDFWRTI